MNIDANHAYSQFYGLCSGEAYDATSTSGSDVVVTTTVGQVVADDAPLPPATGVDRPPCSICKEPNLSLRDERCISCRVGLRRIGS